MVGLLSQRVIFSWQAYRCWVKGFFLGAIMGIWNAWVWWVSIDSGSTVQRPHAVITEALHSRILMSVRSKIITPRSVHRFVQQLCAKVIPGATPLFVEVVPDDDARIDECFFNVAKKCETSAGRIQYGWAIWENPGLFVEAEFHAVWMSETEDYLDVTPHANNVRKILFLQDNHNVFDESSTTRPENVRLPEIDHPWISEFFNVFSALKNYEDRNTDPLNPKQMRINPEEYSWMQMQVYKAEQKMMRLAPDRNAPCRCESGKKFKKCCGMGLG